MNRSFNYLLLVLFFCSTANAIPITVSNAPTDNLSLTVSSINAAQKSIYLNIYELSSAAIGDALLAKIKSGIQVVILEEGAPVGGMSTAAKGIENTLATAMANFKRDHLFQMKKIATARRYRFDHAKYAVIDDSKLLIGSENYSPTGNPTPGTIGNRGWEVLVEDTATALDFKSLFLTDCSLQAGDITDLTQNPALTFGPQSEIISVPNPATLPATLVKRITSPDSSLSGLLNLIQNAVSTIDIEQMTFDSTWNKQAGASPLTLALIDAAKRGVKVRILLNDEHVFDHAGKPAAPHNTDTVGLLKSIPGIDAKIANLKAMHVDYIHNKGVLIDGAITLVSSINWDQNSIEKNREAAVAITSPLVNQYYQNLFDHDWADSASPTGTEMLFDSIFTTDFDCPSRLHLNASIRPFQNTEEEDEDFRSLSGLHMSEDFFRASTLNGCIFKQKDSEEEPLQSKKTIELRTKNGGIALLLEGYTPRSEKLYSIRGMLPYGIGSNKFYSSLFDGSSPSREKLSSVLMEVQLTP